MDWKYRANIGEWVIFITLKNPHQSDEPGVKIHADVSLQIKLHHNLLLLCNWRTFFKISYFIKLHFAIKNILKVCCFTRKSSNRKILCRQKVSQRRNPTWFKKKKKNHLSQHVVYVPGMFQWKAAVKRVTRKYWMFSYYPNFILAQKQCWFFSMPSLSRKQLLFHHGTGRELQIYLPCAKDPTGVGRESLATSAPRMPLPNCFTCNFKVEHLSVPLLRPITLNSWMFFTEMLPWGDSLSNHQISAELLPLLAVAIPSANSQDMCGSEHCQERQWFILVQNASDRAAGVA